VIVEGAWQKESNRYVGRISIPYRYSLAVGIIFIFLGISIVALSGKKSLPQVN
jgi:hypothetical protein